MTVEEFRNDKALPAKIWTDSEEAFKAASAWFKTSDGKDGLQPWIMGQNITLADIIVGAWLAWAVSASGGEESEVWKRVGSWDDGRWKAFWEKMKPYAVLY
jgi:glutathione S-transferase